MIKVLTTICFALVPTPRIILNAKYILPVQKINYGHAEEPV